jgi:hypothetical protein
VGSFAAFSAGCARLLGIELVCGTSFVRSLATFAPRFTSLLGIKLVRRAFLMRNPASFPAFFRVELVRSSLLMSRLSTLAGNCALFFLVHGSKASSTGTRIAIPAAASFIVAWSHDGSSHWTSNTQ